MDGWSVAACVVLPTPKPMTSTVRGSGIDSNGTWASARMYRCASGSVDATFGIANLSAPITPEAVRADGRLTLTPSEIAGLKIDAADIQGQYADRRGRIAPSHRDRVHAGVERPPGQRLEVGADVARRDVGEVLVAGGATSDLGALDLQRDLCRHVLDLRVVRHAS